VFGSKAQLPIVLLRRFDTAGFIGAGGSLNVDYRKVGISATSGRLKENARRISGSSWLNPGATSCHGQKDEDREHPTAG
jgi:hypothetical protein